MSPINIGGDSVSGITIDGDQVAEVTIDGTVVWERYSAFEATGTTYDVSSEGELVSLYYDEPAGQWVASDGETIYEYQAGWTNPTTYDISGDVASIHDLARYNGEWFTVYNSDVQGFDDNWNPTSTSHDISSETTTPDCLTFHAGNWYVVGLQNANIYVYDSSWNYTGTSYDFSDSFAVVHAIERVDGQWYLVDDMNNATVYDDTWTQVNSYSYSVGGLFRGAGHGNGYWYVSDDEGTITQFGD